MVDILCYLTNLLFFDIRLLYCYINLISSIIFCLFFQDICLSFGISLSNLSVIASELFWGEFFEAFVILPALLLPIKSPVASAVFWIALFETVYNAFVAGCLPWSKSFWLYLLLNFLLKFLPIFLAKDKNS